MRLAGPVAVIGACAVEASSQAALQPFSSLPTLPRRLSQGDGGGGGGRRRRRRRRRRRDDDDEDDDDDNDDNGQHQFCSRGVLNNFPTDTMNAYNDCVAELEAEADFYVAGAEIAIQAECWCKHNMAEAYDSLGCCDDPRLWQWCDLDCSPDCSSEPAQTCLEACPAVCMEEHYAPPSCSEACHNHDCHEQMLCITEHAKNRTDAGLDPKVCHDVEWQESQQTQGYQECVTSWPQRTYWNWRNAVNHCICREDLRNATVEHHCCEAEWAGDICNKSFCPDMGICKTDEALDCEESCNTICQNIQAPSSECSEKCLNEDSACAKYLYCEPPPAKPFDYICSSGDAPDDGGCCEEPHFRYSTCPFLCDSGSKLLLPHGAECVCHDCPVTQEEQLEKFEVEVKEGGRLLLGSEAYLNEIVARVGLDSPTSTMSRLMEQRNAEMVDVFEAHAPSYLELLSRLQVVHTKYWHQVEEAAWMCKSDSRCEENPDGHDTDSKDKGFVVGFVVGCGVLICCLLGVCLYLGARRSPKRGAASPANTTEGWGLRQPNVVIGAPVDGQAGGSAAAGAAMGVAPAGRPQAAKDPDDEGNNVASVVVAVGHPVPTHPSAAAGKVLP